MLGRGHQPRGRVFRHALRAPHFERSRKSVLHDVLGERQIVHAEDARERRDQAPGFAAKEQRARVQSKTQVRRA